MSAADPPRVGSPEDRIGLVLSGGGANGAYEVGVMKALFRGASPGTGHRPIAPGILTGTSTGAYNATVIASQAGVPAEEAVAYLEALWLGPIANGFDSCGNGVYRIRGLPFQLGDPGCLARPVKNALAFGTGVAELGVFGALKGAEFLASEAALQSRLISLVDVSAFISETPFLELIHRTVDLAGLARSEKKLTVLASNWARGTVRCFSREEIAGPVGAAAVTASASIPGLFRPTEIEGEPYVDGGVLVNTPLKPAIVAGANEIHVVLLDPLLENLRRPPLPSTADVLYLLLAIVWAARLREDARRVAAINDALAWLAAGSDDQDAAEGFLEYGRRALERRRQARPYRPLTVHIYRPATTLGGGAGLLDFDQDRLAGLIERGYADAVAHDCEAEGCVRVGEGT